MTVFGANPQEAISTQRTRYIAASRDALKVISLGLCIKITPVFAFIQKLNIERR